MSLDYTLAELAAWVGAPPLEPDQGAIRFQTVSTDTRTIQPGDVFFALTGERFDGNRFVADAFQKGAVAAVCRIGA
ncbi:MAG TPA: Mur ligase domain-containing protein, partial [Candidatus Hydrogenedentes bacterium]|nr:Mur ligase domain-containing protein [Candidatus Hydrogenedentota bacterium]